MAEREGFEPPDPCGSTVFKTAAIDHSAISPIGFVTFRFVVASGAYKASLLKAGAKVLLIFEIYKRKSEKISFFRCLRYPDALNDG